MAFTEAFDVTFPPDTQQANLLGLDIRNAKLDIQQRMAAISGLDASKPNFAGDTQAANWNGILFFATDTAKVYQFNNPSWTDVTAAIGLGISGEIRMYAGSAAPAGWLFCQGQAISRTTYAALFTAIGTTFGTGDGSTTFNLPDMRGRVPVGVGQGSGLTNRVLGATGGEENHILSVAEMPAHSHTHSWNFGTPLFPGSVQATNGVGHPISDPNTTDITINNTGGGGGHNTMQPFTAVNFIIKF